MRVELMPLLPPPLIHALRTRSFSRLYQMTGNPGKRGFGRILRQRIKSVVEREKLMSEKAITVAYMGSYLVDHIIFAEKNACVVLEERALTEAEEHHLWEKNYSQVIPKLAEEHPDGESILRHIFLLERYTKLPGCIHHLRQAHWGRIEHMLTEGQGRGPGLLTGMGSLRRIQRVLVGTRTVRAKAVYVCLSASVLADAECWAEHINWADAYAEIMTDLYAVLCHHADVLDQIIKLDGDEFSN